jgi:uncharacterized YigZ family protein
MSADHYQRPAAPAEARLKIERSEFLGIAFRVTSEEEFFDELQRIGKRHFDATHHCWAFRLFAGRQRSSDAGEPSGTAGKPIANAIESAELFDCAVVVVRWYGGVKLGTGGLARAYRDTAAAALGLVPREDRYVYTRIAIDVPFDALGTVYRLVAPPDVVLIEERFSADGNVFVFDVRQSLAESFAAMLVEKRLKVV